MWRELGANQLIRKLTTPQILQQIRNEKVVKSMHL